MLNYLDSDSESEYDEILGKVFFNKYHCIKKLGEGSFGQIYEATYKSEKYALKFENRIKDYNLLQNEAGLINYLKGPNIPYVKSYGFTSNYNILVMQLLGKSLEQLLMERKTFSLKTVCLLGYQMINILEFIHNKHILHRDIKPDNFVMGLNEVSNNVYLIDFGLAKKYRSMTTLIQYPMVKKNKLTGTARYASINALKGYEHSRRDDLESVGYILIYFLRGKLPWQRINAKTKEEKYKKIMEKKIEMKPDILCQGLPDEFKQYFKYVRELQFTEEPNYELLLGLLNNAMKKNNIKNDCKFDWCQNNNNNNSNITDKFISTENLFSKLKLGEINANGQKDIENKKIKADDISDNIEKNNIEKEEENKNIIKEENNNINEKKLVENENINKDEIKNEMNINDETKNNPEKNLFGNKNSE